MFRPATMMRLSVLVLERDERAVLCELGRLGIVQLTRTHAGPSTAPLSPRDRSQELARCDGLLGRIQELHQSLGIPVLSREPRPADLTWPQAEDRVHSMKERADVLLKRRQRLRQRQDKSAAIADRVARYRGLGLPLDPPDRDSFLHFATGSLPAENLARLEHAIGSNVALLPLPEEQGRQPLVAMTTHQGWPALERALQQAGFQLEMLPAVAEGTVDTLSDATQREQQQLAAELGQLEAEVQSLSVEFAPSLAGMVTLATTERRLLEAGQYFLRTEAAVLFGGWVPAADAPALEQRLTEVTGGRCAIETVLPDSRLDVPVPVLLRLPRLLRPFEMLVSTYGLPDYRELEPTLFVALSYVLMFGMMFGDAGHGALLAAGGLIAMLTGRTSTVRDVGLLLVSGGLSSMVFGVVYGSYFGLERFKPYALWHDPLEGDPMRLMSGAIGIGVVMISLGLILNIINRFRRGDVLGGFLDKFGLIGVLFYWGALALITHYAAIQSRGLVSVAAALFLGLPILAWTVKEPLEYYLRRRAGHPLEPGGGLFASITESFVGAFEAVLSYLANTISFVRLAAYAMSHAALLVAALMIAGEVRDIPVAGGVLSVLVIILGNLVAMVLEGIIASVQALRLEYYEFFGKFFSGSGQPFAPFRLAAHEQSPT